MTTRPEAGDGRPGAGGAPSRRLSFKTRPASRPPPRASKVSLPPSSVALLASQFSTIVVDDAAQGRALIKKLQAPQRGAVKAAVEMFELHDSRPKLVVVKNPSDRVVKDNASKEYPKWVESKRSANDSERSESKNSDRQVFKTETKEVKRKPSLKAKPVLSKKVLVKKQENSLDQRIARLSSSYEHDANEVTKTAPCDVPVKPKFNLNERIAQFNKCKSTVNNVEEKENKLNHTKSILRNSSNKQPGIIEQTKHRLSIIVQQNNNINYKDKLSKMSDLGKKQNTINNDFISEEITDVNHSISNFVEGKDKSRDEDIYKRLSVPKDGTLLDNVFQDEPTKSTKAVEDTKTSDSTSKSITNLSASSVQNIPNRTKSSMTHTINQTSGNSTSISLKSTHHPTITKSSSLRSSPKLEKKTLCLKSESPKLEKKPFCVAPDPFDNVKLDRIMPNNSFLWTTASGLSVSEVPIYDDRPEMENNVTLRDSNKSLVEIRVPPANELSTPGSFVLNVSSSFMTEMTEHIQKRFSNGSINDKDIDEELLDSGVFTEINKSVPKNTSFLYSKSTISIPDCLHHKGSPNYLTDVVKDTKCLPNSKSKLPKMKDSPPELPERRRISGDLSEVQINSNPPPVPPSHLKPKRLSLSEEEWIDNCKKILEIPPPLRSRSRDGSNNELTSDSTDAAHMRTKNMIEYHARSQSEKRFLVSKEDILRKMSEMNFNKRNSLPVNSFSTSSILSYIDQEEDGYTSIKQPANKQEDQGTYEAIGENNYSEIQEYEIAEEAREEDDNVYDDVVGAEEDHYEAISSLQQADSDSSCDQSNSLYGLARPPPVAAAVGLYHPDGSEGSDEWVDLDNSDEHHQSVYIVQNRERRAPSATESWCEKVRRHAAHQQVRISSHSVISFVDTKSTEKWLDNDISLPKIGKGLVCFRTNLCLCNKYEAQEAVIFLGKEEGSDLSRRSYENIGNADENSFCDDFDDSLSDSSVDQDTTKPNLKQVEIGGKRPAEEEARSEGIYGFMKQAGQRMRKHWTIKSLSRMGKNKSSPNLNNVGNFGQRGWSFKSTEKPSTAQSTFYLNSTGTLPRQTSEPPPPAPAVAELKTDPRRLSISPLSRPTAPPPPPPRISVDRGNRSKSIYNGSTTSSGDNEGYAEGQRRMSRSSNSQWYVDTSTDTASEHGSSSGSELNLKFADEPLYQFYNAEVVEKTLSELTDSDGYEEVSPAGQPSALDLVSHQHRSLWSELPLVRQSGLLDSLSQGHKRLQEAKFEVLTSEASYFKSLTVLDKVFASCPVFSDDNILSRKDRKMIFGNVHAVRKCSEQLLSGLQKCWQGDLLLQGLCQVVHDHIKGNQQVYIDYCSSQINMDRTLKAVKQTNSNFSTVLASLESEPECQSLTLYSFLMLPMQRITRLRLLVETIHSLLEPADDEFSSCQKALDILNKCVAECNEAARGQERREEMKMLSKQIEFPPEMNVPSLADNSRWLVRSGQVSQVNVDAKLTLGRRLTRSMNTKITLFLFTDLLLVTKRKSEDSYMVSDYCSRNLVEVQELPELPSHTRHLLGLTLLENWDARTQELTMSCESEIERQRWLQVLSPPQSDAPGETLYEGWDCPRVCAVHTYRAQQPDELSLAPGDTVNVLRKTDGWFFGERCGDCEKGWFPGSFTREIASEHVRARNLKQRNKLLKLSANLVQQQQRKVKS